MKLLKVSVSGSYKTASGDIVDFEDVTGVIPFVEEEHAKMHVRARYASEWVRNAKGEDGEKIYKDRIDHVRQVFIDTIEEIEGNDLSFVGKDIKKMTYEELQDLATSKDLRTIPLPKAVSGTDIREMRTRAYIEYAMKVFKDDIDDSLVDFNFADLPEMFVDGVARKETAKKTTNEEMIALEQGSSSTSSPKDTMTLEELRKVAKEKKIPSYWVKGFDKLYAELYS